MELNTTMHLSAAAINVLKGASSSYGIKASSQQRDNYEHIWARDSAVAGLAILIEEIEELYPIFKNSLCLLQQAAAENGQIPSNIKVNAEGQVTAISFGSVAGRTDASFWWIVGALEYLHKIEDIELKTIAEAQCDLIFKLADAWEFNRKDLMYLPMSGNWADEYITHGFVLYDQVLRYWALHLAGYYFKNTAWQEKADAVKLAIKKHFLFEAELDGSLYTGAQQEQLLNHDISKNFIASFSPGDRVEKFDAWSIALLLLLDIPSKASISKLNSALLDVFNQAEKKGIPAFWPIIEEGPLYHSLELNHNFRFKNIPGHFHNGGIWPVVNGFLIAGLQNAGLEESAGLLMEALTLHLGKYNEEASFSEYFDFYEGKPGGVSDLCFSASGYLLAKNAINRPNELKKQFLFFQQDDRSVLDSIKETVQNLIFHLNLNFQNPVAISIAGESGCGKTTLSRSFKEILEGAGLTTLLLHQDDYFKLPPKQNHNARVIDFSHIGPHEVRLSLLDEHVLKIKTGLTDNLPVPHMNWVADTEESKNISTSNVQVILVDGTYTTLLKHVDYKIFFNTTYLQTRKNRISRNRETVTDFIEKVLEKESEIIRSHKAMANVVINNKLEIIDNRQL